MAIIRCKMCGGNLVFDEGATVGECEYCGSKQTIPTVDSEKKMRLLAHVWDPYSLSLMSWLIE